MTTLANVTSCKECGSKSLTWFTQNVVFNGVQQNRLNTSDVKCQFVLGCDDCSETLKVISADKVAEHLNAAPIAQTAPQGLRIVFDGPPGPEAGRFVEVEDTEGRSVNAGEWRERTDGLWELPLHAAPQPEQSGLVTEAMRNAAIAEYDRHDGDFSDFAESVIRAALSAQGAAQ